MDNIIDLLKSKLIEHFTVTSTFLSSSKSKPLILCISENHELVSIKTQICVYFENLLTLFSVEKTTKISNYQNFIQCIYYLVSKVVPTFSLTVTDDILTCLSNVATQQSQTFSSYFKILTTDIEICQYTLQTISMLAKSDPQKFMSAWPFFLTDNFIVDSFVTTISKSVIELCSTFEHAPIESSNRKQINSILTQIKSISSDIETIPTKSFILQMLFLTANSQVNVTTLSISTAASRSSSKESTSLFADSFDRIMPMYNELNKLAILCIHNIFQGIQLHKWFQFQQQLFHTPSISASTSTSPNDLSVLNSQSKQFMTSIEPNNQLRRNDSRQQSSIQTQNRSVGIIGQNRGLKPKSNSLSSLESKITTSVLKFVRITVLYLFCLYGKICNIHIKALKVSIEMDSSSQHQLHSSLSVTSSVNVIEFVKDSLVLEQKGECFIALLDLLTMFIVQISSIQMDDKCSGSDSIQRSFMIELRQLYENVYFIISSIAAISLPMYVAHISHRDSNSNQSGLKTSTTPKQNSTQQQVKDPATSMTLSLHSKNAVVGSSKEISINILQMRYNSVFDLIASMQILSLKWLISSVNEIKTSCVCFKWINNAMKRNFIIFPLDDINSNFQTISIVDRQKSPERLPLTKLKSSIATARSANDIVGNDTSSNSSNWRQKSKPNSNEVKMTSDSSISTISNDKQITKIITTKFDAASDIFVYKCFSKALACLCDIQNDQPAKLICKSSTAIQIARLLFTTLLLKFPSLFYGHQDETCQELNLWLKNIILYSINSRPYPILKPYGSSDSISEISVVHEAEEKKYNLQRILFGYKSLTQMLPCVTTSDAAATHVLSIVEIVTLVINDCTCSLDHQIRAQAITSIGLFSTEMWSILNKYYDVVESSNTKTSTPKNSNKTSTSAPTADTFIHIKSKDDATIQVACTTTPANTQSVAIDEKRVSNHSLGESVINIIVNLCNDEFGSVRDACFRTLGQILLNGAIYFQTSEFNIVSTRDYSIENAIVKAMSHGLLDRKLTVRVQAAFALGNFLEKVLPLRLNYIQSYVLDTTVTSLNPETSHVDTKSLKAGININQPSNHPHDIITAIHRELTSDNAVQMLSNNNSISQSSTVSDRISRPDRSFMERRIWICDKVWLSLAHLVIKLLDGSDKILASISRCLGLVGAGLSNRSSEHMISLVNIVDSLLAKLLFMKEETRNQEYVFLDFYCDRTHTDKSPESFSSHINNAITKSLLQNSQKHVFSLSNALTLLLKYQYGSSSKRNSNGVSGDVDGLNLSNGVGTLKFSNVLSASKQILLENTFVSLLNQGTSKIKLISSRGLIMLFTFLLSQYKRSHMKFSFNSNVNTSDSNLISFKPTLPDHFQIAIVLKCFENAMLVCELFLPRTAAITTVAITTTPCAENSTAGEGRDKELLVSVYEIRRNSQLQKSLLLLICVLLQLIKTWVTMEDGKCLSKQTEVSSNSSSTITQAELLSQFIEFMNKETQQNKLHTVSTESELLTNLLEVLSISPSDNYYLHKIRNCSDTKFIITDISKTIVYLLSSDCLNNYPVETESKDIKTTTTMTVAQNGGPSSSLFVFQSNSIFGGNINDNNDYSRALSNIPQNIFSIFYSLSFEFNADGDGHQLHNETSDNNNMRNESCSPSAKINHIHNIVYGLPVEIQTILKKHNNNIDDSDDEDEF